MRTSRTRQDVVAVSDVPTGRSASDIVFYGYLFLILVEFAGGPLYFPVLKAIRFATLLSYSLLIVTLVQVGVGDLFQHRQAKLLVTLLIMTALSVFWAVVQLTAYNSIRPFVDYFFFFVLTASLVDRRKRFDLLCWTFAVVTVILVTQNLERLGQDVRSGGYKAAYFLGDGNDFAWGLAVMMPFILHLVLGKRGFILRILALGALAVSLVGIIGTGSRGGSLGLGAALGFYWLFMSQKKAAGAAVLALLVVGILLFAPSTYLNRMQSVGNAQEDTSAQARLKTWGSAIDMAFDFPLGVGAGNFASAYGRFYVGTGNSAALGFAANRWFSAHSIYFRTLGEYGFIGLALLLWLIIGNIRDIFAVRSRVMSLGDQAHMSVIWPGLIGMSIVSYAVCGVFLGGLSYPHLFLLSGLTLAAKRAVLPHDTAQTAQARGRRRGVQAALHSGMRNDDRINPTRS